MSNEIIKGGEVGCFTSVFDSVLFGGRDMLLRLGRVAEKLTLHVI